MSNIELFFLGMMAAWTPSLLYLGWMLYRDDPRRPIEPTS
jgi:hypothetical protein